MYIPYHLPSKGVVVGHNIDRCIVNFGEVPDEELSIQQRAFISETTTRLLSPVGQ